MTHTQSLFLAKRASAFGPAALFAGASAANTLPWSTGSRTWEGQRLPGFLTGISTDVGRGVGGLTGAALIPKLMGSRIQDPRARLAMLLGGMGAGAVTGHGVGGAIGQAAFRPTSIQNRIEHALSTLRSQ